MAQTSVGGVIDLVVFIVQSTVDNAVALFSKMVELVNTFLPGFAIGGVPFIIITIVLIGIILHFFGHYLLGTGKTIIVLLLIGMLIGLAIIFFA